MGTGSFLRVKRPGRGVDSPPPSSAEVEGGVKLDICSPSGPSWSLLGWTLPLHWFLYWLSLLEECSRHEVLPELVFYICIILFFCGNCRYVWVEEAIRMWGKEVIVTCRKLLSVHAGGSRKAPRVDCVDNWRDKPRTCVAPSAAPRNAPSDWVAVSLWHVITCRHYCIVVIHNFVCSIPNNKAGNVRIT